MAHGYPDFEGPKDGLYLKSHWEAFRGDDKDLVGATNVGSGSEETILTYTCPAGKVLYIVNWGVQVRGADAGITAMIRKIAGVVITNHGVSGGYHGFSVVLEKPIVYAATETLKILAFNWGTATYSVWATASGYEI